MQVTDTSTINQDADVVVTFYLNLTFTGRPLPPPTNTLGHVGLEFLARADATCDPATDPVVGAQSATTLVTAVGGDLEDGDNIVVYGSTRVHIAGDACSENGQHLCAHYTMLTVTTPAFRDDVVENDCVCMDVSEMVTCTPSMYLRCFNRLNNTACGQYCKHSLSKFKFTGTDPSSSKKGDQCATLLKLKFSVGAT